MKASLRQIRLDPKLLEIAMVEMLATAAFYLLLTLVNFLRLIPDGILVKLAGASGSYRTDVMDSFSSGQVYVLYAALTLGISLTAIYYISGKETKGLSRNN